LAALAPQKRGPEADLARIDVLQIAQLTRERAKLRRALQGTARDRAPKRAAALLDRLATQDPRRTT
jgi:hypothetical protein